MPIPLRLKKAGVVFQPKTYQGMQKGMVQIIRAVRPTLGPLPRVVAIAPIKPHDKPPELLDSGGVIARRIYQLPGRDEDTGAMFIRQVLWRQYDEAGDGTATTAVIFDAVYSQALKYISAGGNAMILRGHLEEGLRLIIKMLEEMTMPVTSPEWIAQVAESVCYDIPLSKTLGEIYDILGPFGQVDIRSGRSRDVEREYVGGAVYDGGLHSNLMIDDMRNIRAQVEDGGLVLTDIQIEDPDDVIPALRTAIEAGLPSLVIVAKTISDKAVGVLMRASANPAKFRAMAVKTPGTGVIEQSAFLDDLGLLTGARPMLMATGARLSGIRLEDIGQARRMWADKNFFAVVGGKGDPRKIRQHVSGLQGRYLKATDKDERKRALTRLGKLMGGSATLHVGGVSEIDIKERKEVAEHAIEAVRGALLKGILPGGGTALLACRPRLLEMAREIEDFDKKTAFRILARALEEPTRVIAENAGYEPSVYIARIEEAGKGYGVDVRTGEVADMIHRGILDSAGVLMSAVHGAISSAALALTVDVMVHRKRQRMANNP